MTAFTNSNSISKRSASRSSTQPRTPTRLSTVSGIDAPVPKALAVGGFPLCKVALSDGSGWATIVVPPLVG
jgi:hypothetical protein